MVHNTPSTQHPPKLDPERAKDVLEHPNRGFAIAFCTWCDRSQALPLYGSPADFLNEVGWVVGGQRGWIWCPFCAGEAYA